ncbi:hypothetical protein BDD12DRAFT_741716, partial [Trichophaea hybrida]
LGKKKEVFDAEVYTIERGLRKAAEMLPMTGDSNVVIFSDSVTTIQRVQDDKLGPGQRMAKNTIEWNKKIVGMGVEIEYQWVPSHKGVEGNEKAYEQAKAAVERVEGTLKLVKGYKGWSMANSLLGETKKRVAGRFLQLKVGHALTGVHLERIKKKESKECWWCGHLTQTVDHLFKWCKKWKRQQDTLWEKLRKKCKMKERGRVPMAQVFDMEEAEKAMLKFLMDTDVGRVTEA